VYYESQKRMTWKRIKLELNWINFYSGHVCSSAAEWQGIRMFLAVCNKSISYQSRKILFCSLSRKQINIWGKELFLITPSWLVSHFQHVYFVFSLYVIVVIRTHNNASVKTWKNLSLFSNFISFICDFQYKESLLLLFHISMGM